MRSILRYIRTPRGCIQVIILLLILSFLFHLLKFNRRANVPSADIKSNIQTIQSYNYSNVSTVEDKLAALDQQNTASHHINNAENTKTQFMKRFRGSVVIGDSLTEGLTAYGYLNDDQVFCKIGASIMTSSELFTSAAKTYPQTAFFAFGMNDIGFYNGKSGPFIKRYASLLKKFHAISPKTRIYVCSVSKPSDATLKKRKALKHYQDFSEAIQKMCASDELASFRPIYIDITGILETHSDLYAGDGIHAQPAYYPYWLSEMAEKAGL